ncbi:hypothetical protein PS938_04610 [Pseudomonas fluorescens]|uniref:Uncharacterized protein n=1 Tax=Pseudomonas fluorescens TaxID=294 RepID=A0A5E7V4W5_PSEFL|nr:hypothetical protein [Pseudomonas fluorescens]VVQ18721.1 hypothetical protein PS938_04610 [Pseudomonas fluorescens]
MNKKNGANAPRGSAWLDKAGALLMALQPNAESLVLLFALEVLLWN